MAEQEPPKSHVPSVMEDPSTQAIARVYAQAFLDAAQATGVEAALDEFGSFVEDVLAAHPEFMSLLVSGIVGRDEKIEIIDRVVAGRGSELLTNFLRVLARHERLDLLPQILTESRIRHETLTGRQRVTVMSPAPLSKPALDKISDKLAASLPFQPILQNETDPSLLGGVVIRIGDTVYDSSLRTRMAQLRERLRQRSLHEIQSGRNRFSHPEGN